MKRFIALLFIAFVSTGAANATNVLTSIKPIQLISLEITQGVTTPDVLLASNASPHDYALRPSDVKRIRRADLVIWYGQDLEPFLSKVLKGQGQVLTLSEVPNLSLREFDQSHHDHDGHDHGSYDPHFWLGYQPTLQVAEAIASKLSEIDPQHAAQYQANYASFKQRLTAQQQSIKQQLEPVQQRGYYVFHDAYGYFEQDFSLKHLGAFTISPDRKPGAKTLISIRRALSSNEVYCLFTEPQFTPAVVKSVTRGSNIPMGVLDPIGSDINAQAGGYFAFKQVMADSFAQCLLGK
ncbi:zinc ABC transporter substrate-binding protein ZnuA [Vibrio sp. JPW-9-11-11]|uniref:zinc ABC transporter substrate-binding protein ZnuA n=1 Tax=Vibrio sp. JPW-9-11-11 TaxID=1416532 RepID=UPI001592C79F|nr:zinc ABC transporter substrate-binding protein ZnuA [Vibrio sp. JPW-9-11-11]NVD06167.1 zinc ABC transporter substrate-binding protein ZnuA [Vibrio sp. JPW-9-11-11]